MANSITMVSNLPLAEIMAIVEPLVKRGFAVYQTFTCTSCGSRQTVDAPNQFYNTYERKLCGQTTNIMDKGCGLTYFTYEGSKE